MSIQIRALEEHFGIALFSRSGPHIALTSAGHSLYRSALPLVEGIDRLPQTFEERFRHVVAPVRIAAGEATAAYLLPRLVTAFTKQYPEIETHVRVGRGTERLSWLRSYEVDLVVTAMDVEEPDLEFKLLVS